MSNRKFVSRFSPNRTEPEVLEAIFVQRHKLAEIWLGRLRDSLLTEVKHHLLAVGPRGCGKSHLVALLFHRLNKDSIIRERARIAWLPEDETTTSFWKFLLRILRALNAAYGNEFPLPPRDELGGATDERRSAILTDYLLKKLDGRALLVIVENLDEVMRGLQDEGQKRWRAFLQEHPVCATLATAQQLTEDVSSRDRPFFNFFQIEHLLPLTADEAVALLRKTATHNADESLAAFLQSARGRARVRALRHISGGSHRVFITVSEFLTREKLDDLVVAFEELLDELTPYYQERIRWLSDQQREIVEFLCRQGRTVPVKEIAGELFLSEQTAAAQLKQLKDKGYVKAASRGRESRYELAEPLMRLGVEVKDPQREPVRLIVEFLRIWYDRSDIKAKLECLPPDANLERRYFSAVLLAHRRRSSDPVVLAFNQDLEDARANGDPDEIVRVSIELGMTTHNAQRCAAIAKELQDLGRLEAALAVDDRWTEIDPKNADAWQDRAFVLVELKRFAEALASEDQAIKLDPNNAFLWSYKGSLLFLLKKYEEALAASERALELEPSQQFAWVVKGATLRELGRFEQVVSVYDQLLMLDPTDALAWCVKAETLIVLGRYDEAFVAYCQAIALQPNNPKVWNSVGFILSILDQNAMALAACERVISLAPMNAAAWGNKAWVLHSLKRDEEALSASQRAVELNPDDASLWWFTGEMLYTLSRHSEAVVAYSKAIELDPKNAGYREGRGRAKLALGKISEAIDEFQRAIELWGEYTEAFDGLATAFVSEGNWSEAERVLSERFRLPMAQPKFERLPDLIVAIFRASSDQRTWKYRVNNLVEMAKQAQGEQKQKQTNPASGSASPVNNSAEPNLLAMLGDSLVRSLRLRVYDEAVEEALNTWAGIWREVAERYSELSLAVRLFSIGVRYIQTKDERILFDLVQEERIILRDLFRLNDSQDHS